MAASMSTNVEVGFVEKIGDNWKLLSHFFPSKVGGRPAWLSLHPVPGLNDVKCRKCEKPCIFFMQVYAPLNEKETCFHRTLFLFICRDANCNATNENGNVIVLRSQLPRDNQFYDSEPPDFSAFSSTEQIPKADKFQEVCQTCGCAGSKKCAKCHIASYCCREHQVLDWKTGHKQSCGQNITNDGLQNKVLFPEFELVTEPEEFSETDDTNEKSEAAKMTEYKEFMQSAKDKGTLLSQKDVVNDLENMAMGEESVDKQFVKFKSRIEAEPDQVLRYQRGGQPLWVATPGQPQHIPPCTCGAAREFEFQVLPQLLIHLGVDSVGDSLDWGTLAVYTCTDSCQPPPGTSYHSEYVWKQDFTDEQPQASR